jgi:hypothetical protein
MEVGLIRMHFVKYCQTNIKYTPPPPTKSTILDAKHTYLTGMLAMY